MTLWSLPRMALLVAMLISQTTASLAQEPTKITWEVTNPFRLFTDTAATDLHRDAFRSLDDVERDRPILNAERVLSSKYPDGWAQEIFRKTCWQSEAHRYGACRKGDPYIRPRHHRVTLRLTNADHLDGTCNWSVTPRRKSDRAYRVRRKRGFCDGVMTVRIPYPAGANIRVRMPDGTTKTERITVKDIFVVGVGDSFGSGEGNPDQPARFSDSRVASYGVAPGDRPLEGYPTRIGNWKTDADPAFIENGAHWLGQACHRSLYSHQTRVALQLAIEEPHRAVTYAHFACGGAEITQGMFVKYKGNEWVPNPPRIPQISSVAEAQCAGGGTPARRDIYPDAYTIQGKLPVLKDMFLLKCPRKKARKIDLFLVSIGGNDVGFSKLVANAVVADKTTLQRLSGWVGGVYGPREAKPFIKELTVRYHALNRALHGLLHISWKESDRVILTGYPPMAIVDDTGRVCPDGRSGMAVFPDFRMNAKKVRQGEDIAATLNTVMKRAARKYKWSFVDSHRRDFIGHGLCAEPSTTSNGFAAAEANDPRIPRQVNGQWEPYPPSEYQAYASRERWFRTPNDAYMTAHYQPSRTIERKILNTKKLRWFKVVLASTYSGAFHPTAEGQAAIADAVLPTARRVLRKYAK